MLFKRVLFASSAAFSLIAPVTQAWAQYRYDGRPALNRPTQQRPVHVTQPKQAVRPQPAMPQSKQSKPAEPDSTPVEHRAKPAPIVPLTDEQIAAKAAVDALLAREPALNAAKAIPDPALARAAAARHDAQERKLAALQAQQDAEAARRRELEAKNRAREEAKPAAPQAKHDAQARNVKLKMEPRFEPTKSKQVPGTVSVPHAPRMPVKPVLRMPAPEGPPLARNL